MKFRLALRPSPISGARAALAAGLAALLFLGWSLGCGTRDAERVPDEVLWLGTGRGKAFEPAATMGTDGRLWVAWLQWERDGAAASLWVAWLEDGRVAGHRVLEPDAEQPAAPVLAPHGRGAYLAWEEGPEDARRIVGRALSLEGGMLAAGEREQISTPGHGRLVPDLAGDGERLVAVWQELRELDYDIVHAARSDGSWSAPRVLVDTPDDDWSPRCALGLDGRLHLVHDVFDGTSFDVRHLELLDGEVLSARTVAGGPEHQANPDICPGLDGELWVAWEAAPAFGAWGPLRDTDRRLRLARIEGDEVRHVPASALPARFLGQPSIAATDTGLVALGRRFMRSRAIRGEPRPLPGVWRTCVVDFSTANRPAELLSGTDGDGQATEVLVPDRAGGVWVVFAADDRESGYPAKPRWATSLEGAWRVGVQRLPAPRGFPPTEAAAPPPPQEQVRDSARPATDGVLFGDLHRHTHLSRCSDALDGTAEDAYRYARGPGGLDFLAITDHFQHMTSFSWWRSLRDVGRYHAPGSLVTLAGAERKLGDKGHFNAVYPHDDPGGSVLVDHLRSDDAIGAARILIPHMMGSESGGGSWGPIDPDLHRLVEVYQGFRGSYEGARLPLEAFDRSDLGASIARGLRSGAHFGLIASSDHNSSGASFAGALGNALDRASVYEALRERRVFAATAQLAVNATLGKLQMGGVGPAPAEAPLRITASGPAPVAYVEVVKNGKLLSRIEGDEGPETLVLMSRRVHPEANPLELEVTGGELLDARLRRPIRGNSVELVGEGLRWQSPTWWMQELVLTVEWIAPPAERSIAVRHVDRVDVVELSQLPRGRSLRMSDHPNERESLWRLGPPLGTAHVELDVPDPERRAGDSYYARIAFTDGNFAWTSPIRVSELVR